MILLELRALQFPPAYDEAEEQALYRDAGDYHVGDCSTCDGSGKCEGFTGGSTFDVGQGQYYPAESAWDCVSCGGSGRAPVCPQCGTTLTDRGHEYGPYCPACHLHVAEMPREAVVS